MPIEKGKICYVYGKWKGRVVRMNHEAGKADVLLFEGYPHTGEKPIYTYLFEQLKLKKHK